MTRRTMMLAWALATIVSPAMAATPAETQIQAARARIEAGAAQGQTYDALAVGLTRRARETGDAIYYDRALEALDAALALDPDDAETLRIAVWARMGRHEFTKARSIAARLLTARPDDWWILALMGDAQMELGEYEKAEIAYQRMVDLRPGPASYSRVACARELRGDLEGSLALMRMALRAVDSRETEDRAWLLVQVGRLQELSGDLAGAEASYHEALGSFPGYHYALAGLAENSLGRGRAARAAAWARAAIEAAPHAERYLVLADALRAGGDEPKAREAEETFETLALAHTMKNDNENHDLVLYYLDRRPDPRRALAIARHEAAVRRDVHTLDRLALALHRNGRRRAARRLMAQVVATGTRETLILRHATEIEGH